MFDHQFVSERGPNKRCLCLSDCSLLPVLAAKAGFEKVCRFLFIYIYFFIKKKLSKKQSSQLCLNICPNVFNIDMC